MKARNGLVVFIGFLLPVLVAADENTDTMRVWLDFNHIEVQRAAQTRYRNILEKTFGKQIEFSVTATPDTDLRLTNRESPADYSDWYRALYLIDVIPAFSAIRRQGTQPSHAPLVGIIRRPYEYSHDDSHMKVNDMYQAITLLKNKRLDIILDYERESGYYLQVNDGIEITDLTSSQNVYVWFKDKTNSTQFNLTMKRIAGTRQVTEAPDTIAISSEDATTRSPGVFTWLLIPKVFDPQTNELSPSDIDLSVSLWLESQLPDYRIETGQANIAKAYEALQQRSDICIINTSKREERENIALFTLPTYTFLDYRLYALKGSLQSQILSGWFTDKQSKPLSFSAFFNEFPTSIFGYYEYLNRAPDYDKTMEQPIRNSPFRFIRLTRVEYERSLNLLKRGRIDYLIAFPTVMHRNPEFYREENAVVSFPLEYYSDPRVSYLACSDSQQGQEIVEKINQVLNDEEMRGNLKSLITENLLPGDRKAYEMAFDSQYR